MQFSTSILIAALASFVSAQNPFTFTNLTTVTAGTPFNITWAPSTGTTDTVTLVLRQGDSKALTTVETIASNIQNTGSYLWNPSPSLVAGTGYAFQILDDGNKDINNYSGQFTLDSTNTVSSALPSSTSAPASSASSPSSAASLTSAQSSSASVSSKASSSAASSSSSQASKTSAAASSSSTKAPSATGNAAVAVKVGGALLGVVGAVMAAL